MKAIGRLRPPRPSRPRHRPRTPQVPAHEASGVPVAEALGDPLALGDRSRRRAESHPPRSPSTARLLSVTAAIGESTARAISSACSSSARPVESSMWNLRRADGGQRVCAELVELERLCDLQRILCHGDRLLVVSLRASGARGECEHARLGGRWTGSATSASAREKCCSAASPSPRYHAPCAREGLRLGRRLAVTDIEQRVARFRERFCRGDRPPRGGVTCARRNRRSGRSGSPSGQSASASA